MSVDHFLKKQTNENEASDRKELNVLSGISDPSLIIEVSLLPDFDLETDALILNSTLQLERDSQWASVSYQLFVSTDYVKLLRKQVSDWLVINRNYKKAILFIYLVSCQTNIIPNWSEYCKKVAKHKQGDYLTLCAISNLHNARYLLS